ncbi:MAG TPA: alpha/beta fold hydrolase [Candidatus Acidoferrales bacterium]|nr:alpha/beta fold hydrolase [Candidatus Acidoferrales bacterium]
MLQILLVACFFLLLSLWGFYISIRPPRILSATTPKNFALDYEEISFVTEDRVRLRGWFIPCPRGATTKTIIALHGYPADKGNILPVVAFLSEKYNLLLFDFRYLGESEGRYSAVGGKETRDLAAAVAFLKARGAGEIGVWGFSMGAAVALMAAPGLPEIRAIVSESSYAQLDLMAPALYQIPGLRYPLAWLTGVWSRLFLGVNLSGVSPQRSARRLTIPVLVSHSKTDQTIPFEHALLLKAALKENPKAEFWFHDDLFHGQLAGDYQKRVAAFFAAHL